MNILFTYTFNQRKRRKKKREKKTSEEEKQQQKREKQTGRQDRDRWTQTEPTPAK